MPGKIKDITGQTFNQLRVLAYLGMRPAGNYRRAEWACVCSCGNLVKAVGSDLRSGNTKSCGCHWASRTKESSTKHGQARDGKMTGAYRSYQSMMQRCYDPRHNRYSSYGGRGIGVCDRWRGNFSSFFADMGERPDGGSIERKDNDGDYSPSNCVWIPRGDQVKNQTRSVWVRLNGEVMIQADAARKLGVCHDTIAQWRADPSRIPDDIQLEELTA